MSFLSPAYLLFFPCTALVYFLLPRRAKNPWLLAASWFFYLCAKPIYLVFLLFAVCSTYVTGLVLEGRGRKKGPLALCAALNLGLLVVFKYLNFAISLAGRGLAALGLDFSAPVLDLLLPAGLSFYLFQAVGYAVDVYRGKIPAQRSFLRHALFLSFFPSLLSGPINRAGDLAPQFEQAHPFCYGDLRAGLLRFLWGAFKKLVLADRLAVAVNTVFAAPHDFGALQVFAAAAAFSLQIYCDFSAYSDMALGSARMMGFRLRENFRTPYFSQSIQEFWRRWHISLSSWFRDYLYIPLGGSRKGTGRKYLNVLIVFAVSGLWHGAALSFVVWGLLNGLYQVAGALTAPARDALRGAIGLREGRAATALWRMLWTFLLSTAAWVFFQAGSVAGALDVFSAMLSGPLLTHPVTAVGLDRAELLCAVLGLLALLIVDALSVRTDLISRVLAAPRPARWAVYLGLLLATVIFGSYGAGYDAQNFIYFQF